MKLYFPSKVTVIRNKLARSDHRFWKCWVWEGGGQTHPMYIDKQKCLNKKNKQYIFTNLENPTLWGRGMVIIKNFNCNDNFVIFTPISICSQKSGGEVAINFILFNFLYEYLRKMFAVKKRVPGIHPPPPPPCYV